MDSGAQYLLDALARSGRSHKVHNGEICTRCGICGDSRKNANHGHLYINLEYPHPWKCHRCGAGGHSLTASLIESLSIAERDIVVYVRNIEKEERRSGRSRRRPPSLAAGSSRLVVPPPDRADPDDARAIGYIEKRIGGPPLSPEEVQRYKIIACGLYGFLEANDVDSLTVHQREGDRLNETCVGFLSADESYIIWRTMDDEHVRNGGRRYTNYRIFQDWEGSKSFACRADVDLLAPSHRVVCAEGILDLLQIERQYYNTERWESKHVGVATCGSGHDAVLRQLLTLGILSQEVELYIDNEDDGAPDRKLMRQAGKIREASPFFSSRDFGITVWRNSIGKDFGVLPEAQIRQQVKV